MVYIFVIHSKGNWLCCDGHISFNFEMRLFLLENSGEKVFVYSTLDTGWFSRKEQVDTSQCLRVNHVYASFTTHPSIKA